ncbi:MAG: EAL domain-containing protein [Pseudomonadota bacterium]
MPDEWSGGTILPEGDGSHSASFGPFLLKTALQPIFGRDHHSKLQLRGFEGLLRLFRNEKAMSTAEFFARVGSGQRLAVDALCRRLHLINASIETADGALLFLNFDPSLYLDHRQIAGQIQALVDDVEKSQFSPPRIVCEMLEKQIVRSSRITFLTDGLREAGFKIAVDDYGAESSDARRVNLLRPDIIKLDAQWVMRLMQTQSGYGVLNDAVERFRKDGAMIVMEGLEEGFHVELAWGAGADLIQGFAVARPQLAPTRISETFGNGRSS